MTSTTLSAMGDETSPHPSLFAQAEWIRALAQGLVRDAAAANDLTQEALMDALRADHVNGDQERPWVAGVAQNLAKGQRWTPLMKRRKRRTEAALEAVRIARYTPTKEETFQRAKAHQWLVGEMLALPNQVRSVLLQCYFEGRSPEDIAEREGTSLAQVSSSIAESRAALRRRLDHDSADRCRTEWISSLAPLLTPSGETPLVKNRWRLGNLGKLLLCIFATPGLIIFLVMMARTLSEISQAIRLLGTF